MVVAQRAQGFEQAAGRLRNSDIGGKITKIVVIWTQSFRMSLGCLRERAVRGDTLMSVLDVPDGLDAATSGVDCTARGEITGQFIRVNNRGNARIALGAQ